MSTVHACLITHLQKVLNGCLFDDDVHCYFSLKAGVQEVLENVHVGEDVHDYADELLNMKVIYNQPKIRAFMPIKKEQLESMCDKGRGGAFRWCWFISESSKRLCKSFQTQTSIGFTEDIERLFFWRIFVFSDNSLYHTKSSVEPGNVFAHSAMWCNSSCCNNISGHP